MKLQKIIMSKQLLGLVEVSLKELVLVFVISKRNAVLIPTFLERRALSDVATTSNSVQDLIDPGLEGVFLIVELHCCACSLGKSLTQRSRFGDSEAANSMGWRHGQE